MMSSDFFFEYEYTPSPDSVERLEQAWDIIFALIVEEIQTEEQEKLDDLENEKC
jgi:hypothetical protein